MMRTRRLALLFSATAGLAACRAAPAVVAPVEPLEPVIHQSLAVATTPVTTPLRQPQTVALRSVNYPDRAVRHRNGLVELTSVSTEQDRLDSTFRLVPGLSDPALVSFESTSAPGRYLRDDGGRLKLVERAQDPRFEAEATFRPIGGLANLGGLSFESSVRPGNFVRHRGFALWVEAGKDDLFRKDTTFRVVDPITAPPPPPPPVSPRGVHVIRATYGRLCGAPGGNFTAHAAQRCNGRDRCDILIDNRHGDPTPGCNKDFSVEWRCGEEPGMFHASHAAVAGEGYGIPITCDADRLAAEEVLLHDEFGTPRLDTAKWAMSLQIPQGSASVNASGGRVELVNRGHLTTLESFDPAAFGAIRITGEWTYLESGDFLQILTRSDGIPAGQWGETKNGIELGAFLGTAATPAQHLAILGRGSAYVTGTAPVPFTLRPGETFVFEVVDAPPHVRFTLTKKGDPGRTATVKGDSTYWSPMSRITFHNRETQGARRAAFLDDVMITAIPGTKHPKRPLP